MLCIVPRRVPRRWAKPTSQPSVLPSKSGRRCRFRYRFRSHRFAQLVQEGTLRLAQGVSLGKIRAGCDGHVNATIQRTGRWPLRFGQLWMSSFLEPLSIRPFERRVDPKFWPSFTPSSCWAGRAVGTNPPQSAPAFDSPLGLDAEDLVVSFWGIRRIRRFL